MCLYKQNIAGCQVPIFCTSSYFLLFFRNFSIFSGFHFNLRRETFFKCWRENCQLTCKIVYKLQPLSECFSSESMCPQLNISGCGYHSILGVELISEAASFNICFFPVVFGF